MKFFAYKKRSSTQAPGPPNQEPALASWEELVGCEIVYEGESPLKAEYVLSFYYGQLK